MPIKKQWFLSLPRWVKRSSHVYKTVHLRLFFSPFLAADRSITSSLQEAREAMTNVACDVLRACLANNASNRAFTLMVPYSLRLIPLYMLSMIKSVRSRPTPCGLNATVSSVALVQTAFRAGGATKLDDRAYYLDLCKTLPIQYLMQIFYPDLYPIHTIEDKVSLNRIHHFSREIIAERCMSRIQSRRVSLVLHRESQLDD